MEGDDAPTLYTSLMRLAKLPPNTKIYCTHEYTLSNARFARSVDPQNAALLARYTEIEKMRAQGIPTIPALLAEELATNPFLRANAPEIRSVLAMPDAPAVEVFAELRRRKDKF